MGQGRGIKAWLELMRISNAPTVVSNVLVGCAIGAHGTAYAWRAVAVVAPAMVLFYIAGMIHNDVMDSEIDRAERPHRPIPSGRVKRSSAVLVSAGMMLAGVVLLLWTTWAAVILACGLLVLIVTYNTLHRLTTWAVLIMGGCRALVYLTAAAAVGWPIDWRWAAPLAVLLLFYVVVVSLIARSEAGSPHRVRLVVAMICGISVMDAALLELLGYHLPALVAVICFATAVALQRRVLGS